MFAGTGSDVGKSVIAAGFCRIFKQDGYTPAPFKAQNMSLNSYATPDGFEIGRAQAVQAEAAGIPCSTDMNPLLLKPNSDHTSQVVLNGKPRGNSSAYDYFKKEGRQELRSEVNSAFDRLAAKYNPVVMEGAGSVSEINLREVDIVNMPMAIYTGASVILVADIERGGVFASVYGSIMLMTEEERERVKGIIINKFRGDIRLFEQGVKMIEQLCNVPVIGVLPYYKDIYIEAEDSLVLGRQNTGILSQGKINIAVILVRHLSNFTDFNVLEHDPRIHLFYTNNVDEIQKADIVIIPGSKSTLDDLYELRRNGAAAAIITARKNGATILGICGGYQMMGMEVCDPLHVEGDIEKLPGLGLLPTTTTMCGEKVTRQVQFKMVGDEKQQPESSAQLQGSASTQQQESDHAQQFLCRGYEIHMGETTPYGNAAPSVLNLLKDGGTDGTFADRKCMGTYIHGILDNSSFINYLLEPYTGKLEQTEFDYAAFKEEQYDKLANHIRKHCNIEKIYEILTTKSLKRI